MNTTVKVYAIESALVLDGHENMRCFKHPKEQADYFVRTEDDVVGTLLCVQCTVRLEGAIEDLVHRALKDERAIRRLLNENAFDCSNLDDLVGGVHHDGERA